MNDDYSSYETGLRHLLDRLKKREYYSEALVYQQRLTENVNRSRRYGDTEQNRAERSEIIDRLNELALSVIGTSFSELCKEPYHNLPQRDYGRFVGRDRDQQELRRLLQPYPEGVHSVISIAGIGGVGKSALALETAYHYLDGYHQLPESERFDAIIWFSAKEKILTVDQGIQPRPAASRTVSDLYTAISVTFGRQDIIRARSIAEQDALARQVLKQHRTLLVLDNLETVDDHRLMAFVREPPAPTKVIITTRHWIGVAYPMELQGMSQDDSLNLIAQECEKRDIDLEEVEAEQLYDQTSGVPLAIVWSIAQMSFYDDIETVLHRLRLREGDIARYCFESSVATIREGVAHKLLMALSLFATDASREALGKVAGLDGDTFGRDKGLERLQKLSLVNRSINPVSEKENRFSMLPLTRQFVRGELSDHPDFREETVERWVKYHLSRSKELSVGRQQYAQFSVEADNFYAVMDWCHENEQEEQFASLVLNLSTLMWAQGYWTELIRYLMQARDYGRTKGNTLVEARAERAVGRLLLFMGDNEKAEIHLEKANELFKAMGEPDWRISTIGYQAQLHVNTSYNLGGPERTDHLKIARRLIEQAFQIARTRNNLTQREQAFRERLIARLHRIRAEAAIEQGDLALAADDLDEAAAYRQDRDEISGGLGVVYRLRGQLALEKGDLDQAKEWAQRSLNIAEEVGVQQDITRVKKLLAQIALRQGNELAARQHLEEARDIYKQLGLNEDADKLNALLCDLPDGAPGSK